MSVTAAFIFPSNEGPRYVRGVSVNIAFASLAIVLSLGTSAYLRMENRRRDRVEGGRPPVGTVLNVIEQHDLAPGFRCARPCYSPTRKLIAGTGTRREGLCS
jgi:hypothetical protein